MIRGAAAAAALLAGQLLAGCAGSEGAARPEPPQDGAPRIDAAEAGRAVESGEAVLVDIRLERAYAEGHARGAVSLPFPDLLIRMAEIPRDRLVVLY